MFLQECSEEKVSDGFGLGDGIIIMSKDGAI